MRETIPDILDEMATSWHSDSAIYVCHEAIPVAPLEEGGVCPAVYRYTKKAVTLDGLRERLASAYNWQHAHPDPTRVLLTRLVELWEASKYSQLAVFFEDAKEFLEHTELKGGK